MNGTEWRAEGIAHARAAGGVDLDLYRPPGFARRPAVRRTLCDRGYVGSGMLVFADPDHPDWDSKRKGDRR